MAFLLIVFLRPSELRIHWHFFHVKDLKHESSQDLPVTL